MLQTAAQGQGVEVALRAVLVWVRLRLARRRLERRWRRSTQYWALEGGSRGSQRLSWRRSALFTADGAFAYSQSHWRLLV